MNGMILIFVQPWRVKMVTANVLHPVQLSSKSLCAMASQIVAMEVMN